MAVSLLYSQLPFSLLTLFEQDMIGKDLSRVCLPVYFNEPLSMLQKLPEDVEYSELLDQVTALVSLKMLDRPVRLRIGSALSTSDFLSVAFFDIEAVTLQPYFRILARQWQAGSGC